MIKIWGRRSSSNTAKVLWCLAELKLECEIINTGASYGGNRDEPYASLNPNGRVPTIQDGDFVLWESNAIVRYLCAKYREGHLFPADLKIRGAADKWMDWTISSIQPGTSRMFHSTKTPTDKWSKASFKKLSTEEIQSTADEMIDIWSILDCYLTKHPFVAGEQFSMGDIPVGMHL
jgi:glutathione S-transferase